MTDLTAQFDATREIVRLVQAKEGEVPAALWAAAGLKPGTRLKDVQAKVVELKKRVSGMTKAKQKEEEEADAVPGDKDEDDKGAGRGAGGNTTKKDTKGNARQGGRDKKSLLAAVEAGDHDLGGDRMYYDGDGDLAQL